MKARSTVFIKCFICIMLVVFEPITAQQIKIDSLLNFLKTDKEDSSKVDHLIDVARLLQNQNADTALMLNEQALKLSQKIPYQIGIGRSYHAFIWLLYLKGDQIRAIEYGSHALTIWDSLLLTLPKADKKNTFSNRILGYKAKTIGNIGIVYSDMGNYPKAIECYIQALNISESLENVNGMITWLLNIGSIHGDQGNYTKALDNFIKALHLIENQKDKDRMMEILTRIGNVYLDQGNFQMAFENCSKALKLAEETNNKKEQIYSLKMIGAVYKNKGDYIKARACYFIALKLSEQLRDKLDVADCNEEIGAIYILLQQYTEAHVFLFRALNLGHELGTSTHMKDGFLKLSELYEKSTVPLKDTIGNKLLNKEQMRLLSLYYYKRYIKMKEEIFTEEKGRQLLQKEMYYEFNKKTAADSVRYSAEKQIKDVEIALRTSELNNSRSQFWIVVCGLLILGFAFILIMNRFRITTQQKKIIEIQKDQIVESINYSKKIQDAMLPNIKEIESSLSGFFIFNSPKDIVSGDFYWFKQMEDYCLLACVDCTGHGVPGAFMSTVGRLLLDKINNSNIRNPSEILKQLNTEIIKALNQNNGGEIQDGMDLSICLVDKKNRKIEFSGARNGIIIISQGKPIRYKANLYPVGGKLSEKKELNRQKFSTETIDLHPDDWVFMYTDGMIEQIGGIKNETMDYSRFEKLLLNISQVDGNISKTRTLENELNNWRGKSERLDDVLIIGFQLG